MPKRQRKTLGLLKRVRIVKVWNGLARLNEMRPGEREKEKRVAGILIGSYTGKEEYICRYLVLRGFESHANTVRRVLLICSNARLKRSSPDDLYAVARRVAGTVPTDSVLLSL